jgi:exodeoxyribonuclease VII small subunit
VSEQGREHRSEERARSGAVRGERTEGIVSSAENAEPTTTYEQAREELADVVRRLEAGGLTLEDSLSLWERGEELATICQHWLDRARERLAAAAPGDQSE